MSNKNFYELSTLNKNKLTCMIEALKIELLENVKKCEDILKDTSRNDNFLLEKQINTCFELQCKIDDYSDKLKELESTDNYTESPNTVVDFISNIPNVVSDLGPESLVVVTSEKVGMQYVKLLQALTAGEVNVTLGNVKTALLDGSEEEYQKFVGSETVRLVIADHVPAYRLYRVRGDVHRYHCFAMFQTNCDGNGDQ
ncbi:hypothetical protein AGLY_013978 [Aphis glycines]|uniref:Uncharacterized protein n=1 Tax=Aphis glycines TaxID=307491 RepID=A0A6G0T5L7_APHGL|nr:hypothetical protein AGLY_013978 [Aphis glycines]